VPKCLWCQSAPVGSKWETCSSCQAIGGVARVLVGPGATEEAQARREALFDELGDSPVPSKRGRKRKGPDQLHDYEKVYKLRESGLSFGKIALAMWGDANKRNRAAALYQRAVKNGFPPIQRRSK